MTTRQTIAVWVAGLVLACQAETSTPDPEAEVAPVASVRTVVAPEVSEASDDPPPEDEIAFEALDLDPKAGALTEQLTVQAAKAIRAGKTPYVEMRANWCPICKRVDGRLRDPKLRADLGPVVLIRVDTDRFAQELLGAGLTSKTIPAFYELDRRGRPTDHVVNGHHWGPKADLPGHLRAYFRPSAP